MSHEERQAAFLASWTKQLTTKEYTVFAGLGELQLRVRQEPETWRLVTTGLWSLGFELSLRAPRAKDELAPPAWMRSLFEGLVAAARKQVPGTHQSLLLERAPEGAPEILGAVFTPDASFEPVRAADQDVSVLLAIGVSADEERLVREWNPEGLVEVMTKVDPLLRTSPDRVSLLQSPRARGFIEQRVEREGSSLQRMRALRSELKGRVWVLSPEAVPTLTALLKGRTNHQRVFVVEGAPDLSVVPADVSGFVAGAEPALRLTQSAARQLRAQLKAQPGRYTFEAVPDFTIEVV